MSSLKDLASLIMVPSLVKDGRLDTVKPLGNSIIHPDATGNNDGTDGSTPSEGNFTFSRGSNLAATRVDVNGLIEKGRENLLLQSNTFDTTWSAVGINRTSGQSGYDGTNNAWKIESTNTGQSRLAQTISISGVNTISFYAKAGTANYIVPYIIGSGDPRAFFNLSTGVVGTTAYNIDASMEDVGGGWYRCSMTLERTSSSLWCFVSNTDNNFNSAIGDSIYIQDAQLESGLVATDVIETGASTAQSGILEDLPRLDYSGGASCPSLLLEPQRTNVVTNSEYVSSKDYVVGNWTGTITSNTTETLSPDGGYNATKFVKAGASDRVYFHNNQPDGAYTGSIYLKAASGSENTTIEISIRRFGGGGGSRSKLVTITNEWQRFDVSATNLTGGTTTAMYISDFSSQGTATEFYSYGMQIEAGSYPTSYIPTYGSAVTRSADDVNELTGATSLIGQSEGTLFLEFETPDVSQFCILYQVRTTGSTNVGQIDFRIQSGNLRALGDDGGANVFNISAGAIVSGTRYKCAVRYANNDVAFYVNGVLKGSDTNASFSSSSLNQIGFNENTGTFLPSVSISQALVFPTALTDTELASLTTI